MNILLVDDQPSILASLVSCIPWHSLGLSSVYTACSAREARKILEKNIVDILISDIEMPGEDGLDLLTWVRDQNMDTECILLTSHADFFYAKRAISLRVSDYIIQPARDEDVIRAVKKAMANRQTNSHKNDLLKYQGQDFEGKNEVALSIFSDWPASSDISIDPDLISDRQIKLSALNVPCTPNDDCLLLYGHIRSWHRMPQTPSLMISKYRRIVDNAFQSPDCHHLTWFPKDNFFYTLILTDQLSNDAAMPGAARTLPPSGGVQPAASGTILENAIRKIYDTIDAELGCRLRLFYAATDFVHLREAMDALFQEEDHYSYEHQSEEVCLHQVEISQASWENDPLRERNVKQLERIKAYIHEHMAEPITRTQIADDLLLSPSYVSHIIKELEDMSCKELVTAIKMTYAQKLLRSSRYSIGDIAARCGYDSFAYFSKVYKATYGITPSSEREMP